MQTKPLEADTRNLINKSLENLGWKFEGINKNVFQEQPRTEEERKKLHGKRADYVLYSKESDKPLMVIEAKKRGERIDKALEQGILYAKELEAPIVFATDGLFCKSYHTKFEKTPMLNGEEVDEFLREALALKYLNTWEVNTISPKVKYSRQELIKIFNDANNMLRGDGLRAGIERFGEFANILFLKLISESEDIKKQSGIETKFNNICHWDYIKELHPESRIEHINKIVYDKLNKLYNTDIFTPLTIRDTDILKEIMDKLDPLTLTDVDSDVKGDAFEYFLKESTASGNDLGEYFTPRHIVKAMVKIVNPQIGEKIYDPFCGTGGFLIESFRHIWNNMPRNDRTIKDLKENTIFGNEITNTARITKMNMILAGDGHSGIQMKDSLANPVDGKYDIVLANMPYSQKTKYGNLYDIKTTNGDSICVQHCMRAINSTSENGRMAIVVPEGFLFRKDLEKTRELLLKRCELKSIISLPQGVFLPYTGVKTNIIYATKINQKILNSSKKKSFWYFDVKKDGYSLDNQRRKLDDGSDLDVYQEYRKLDNDQRKEMLNVGFSIIDLSEVKKNSYILAGNRYIVKQKKSSKANYKKIGELCELATGTTPSTKDRENYVNGTIKWIVSGDLHKGVIYDCKGRITEKGKKSARLKIHKKGSVLIALNGQGKTRGTVAILETEATCNQSIISMYPKDSNILEYRFLYYVLKGMYKQIRQLTGDKQRSGLNMGIIKEIEIPILPIEDQKDIVNELDKYSNMVNGAKAVIDNYEFDFKISSKWQEFELKDICEIIAGQSPKSEYYNNNGNGLAFYQGSSEFGNMYLREPKIWTSKISKKAIKNDILLSVRAPVGDVNICTDDICIGRGLMALRCKKEIEFKYLFLILRKMRYELNQRASGSTFKGITKNEVERFKVRIPSIDKQKEIIDMMEKEKKLIEPSEQIVELFTKKIETKISQLF